MSAAATPRFVVRNLTKHFPLRGQGRENRVVHAVDDVNLTVEAATTLAIVGESGCGKSTLARCMVGLMRPTSGAILLDGEDLTDRDALRQHRREVQFVSQDPLSALNRSRTVGATIVQAMKVHDVGDSSKARRQRAGDLLEQVGLRRDYMGRRPTDLSGGEMQRAVIARALAVEPSVLVLDEPTSSLDVSVKAVIANLLLELQATLGLTYVMITHEIDLARHMSDRIAVMYLGRVAEDGPTVDMFAAAGALHPYSQLLFAAQPLPDPRHRRFVGIGGEVPSAISPPSGCRFHTRCPIAIDRCTSELPLTEALAPNHLVACHRASEHLDASSTPRSELPPSSDPGVEDALLGPADQGDQ